MLDRVPDVTRDRINPKETLKFLELHAVEKIFTLNLIQLEGVPSFYERPNFTKENFLKSTAYSDWRKMVDQLNPSVTLSSNDDDVGGGHLEKAVGDLETEFKVPIS